MKKPAAKKTTAVKHPFTAAHKREDKIRRLRRELRAAEHSPASPKKTVKVVKAAKKPRAWSPDGDVACCSARAVAEALRLATGRVLSDADVVSLYWSTASDPDAGQTLTEAFSAAEMVVPGFPDWLPAGERIITNSAEGLSPADVLEPSFLRAPGDLCPLILGLELPDGEPHAVTVDIDGTWWSWGQPYKPADFPGAVIEEAWAVTW
jgi:hypothetical protein